MDRFEIHVANKGVVLPRQKLFISLAESCCWQESVLLGWNKSSTWFQDNLRLQETATSGFVKETQEKRINKYSSVLLILFTTWWQGFFVVFWYEFLIFCYIFKDQGRLCRTCCLLFCALYHRSSLLRWRLHDRVVSAEQWATPVRGCASLLSEKQRLHSTHSLSLAQTLHSDSDLHFVTCLSQSVTCCPSSSSTLSLN